MLAQYCINARDVIISHICRIYVYKVRVYESLVKLHVLHRVLLSLVPRVIYLPYIIRVYDVNLNFYLFGCLFLSAECGHADVQRGEKSGRRDQSVAVLARPTAQRQTANPRRR